MRKKYRNQSIYDKSKRAAKRGASIEVSFAAARVPRGFPRYTPDYTQMALCLPALLSGPHCSCWTVNKGHFVP